MLSQEPEVQAGKGIKKNGAFARPLRIYRRRRWDEPQPSSPRMQRQKMRSVVALEKRTNACKTRRLTNKPPSASIYRAISPREGIAKEVQLPRGQAQIFRHGARWLRNAFRAQVYHGPLESRKGLQLYQCLFRQLLLPHPRIRELRCPQRREGFSLKQRTGSQPNEYTFS